ARDERGGHALLGRPRRHIEERLRAEADREAERDERRERPELAPVHVLEALVLLVRQLAEEDALIEPEHVRRAEDDAEARPRGPAPDRQEGARQDRELADEAVQERPPDRRQEEDNED